MQRPWVTPVRDALRRLAEHAAARVVFARHVPERTLHIRIVTLAPFMALGAALAAYAAWPGAATAIVAGSLLTAVAGALWLIRAQALGLTAERRLTYAPLQVGDEIEEQITLLNASTWPIIARLDDASTLHGYSLSGVQSIDARGARVWRLRAVCNRRGIAMLGPWTASWQDPFGLFEARVTFGQRREVVVVPPLARAELSLTPRRARLGDRALLRQPLRADSAQVASVREYAAGDPVQRIHWPTSARRQAWFVKRLDPEASSDVWLLPDFCRAASGVDGAEEARLESLILLVVAAADQLLSQRLRVGLACVVDAPIVVPARQGRGQLWPILRALAPIQTSKRSFNEVLADLRSVVPARARVIALSADVAADWPARAAALGRAGGLDLILMETNPVARSAWHVVEALQQLGWPAQAIAATAIRPLLGAYGPLRRWEFRALGTGRIVAQQTPRGQGELEGHWP